MYRIDDATAVAVMPTPGAAGTQGFFTEGSPVAGQAATIVTADFLNMLQEELRAVVVAGGLTPTKGSNTQVLAAIQALINGAAVGVGQSWQNLSASRTPNTTYTNTTGRSIMVSVGMITDVAQGTAVLFVNGVALAGSSNYVTGTPMSLVTAIVPPGATYLAKMANGNTTLQSWAELR